MADTFDVTGPFLSPRLTPGLRDGVEIIEGHRVYHRGSAYPFEGMQPFFEIDAYRLRHRTYDGGTSGELVREVFERGDAVGVLLYNRDTQKVIVVEQFRLPTLEAELGSGDKAQRCSGWIVETIAGMVRPGESPDETAIRETFEETGYRITDPHLIAEYFSSPGGTSEKIYLYFKEVTTAHRTEEKSGIEGEDIKLVEYSLDELAAKLRARAFVDPKLVIAAYHLKARLGLVIEPTEPLQPGEHEVGYRWRDQRFGAFEIAIKTGDVLKVQGVDIWLNPSNRFMMLSQVVDKGLTATIRWGGAKKYSDGTVAVDVIGNSVRTEMRGRTDTGDVIESEPGELWRNGVRRLLHLPISRPEAQGRRLYIKRQDIRLYITRALETATATERSPERLVARWRDRLRGHSGPCSSVLIPMIGTGEAHMSAHVSVIETLAGIQDFLETAAQSTSLRKFHLLAYHKADLEKCLYELDASKQLERKTVA